VPNYRGSDHYSLQVLPVPYIAYRSERVQITRSGLKARLFALDRLMLTVSAGGSLPGSRNDPNRSGMPAINPTFEIGPSLDYRMFESRGGWTRTTLRLPARAVVAGNGLRFNGAGWVFAPNIHTSVFQSGRDWNLGHHVSAGPLWATEGYHDYYYEVDPQFALPERRAYDARGGYSGARFTAASSLRYRRWGLGVFANYDWLDGAAFDDSPLVKTRNSVTSGLFLTYRFYSSEAERSIDEDTQ
jgi:outer membrane scaffolding protein for murein synthesis (MipA/OmpV family)